MLWEVRSHRTSKMNSPREVPTLPKAKLEEVGAWKEVVPLLANGRGTRSTGEDEVVHMAMVLEDEMDTPWL